MQVREHQHTPETSRLAFEDIKIELSRQEKEVVDVLILYGARDWSLREICDKVPFDIRVTSRIVYDLKKKGAMFERLRRECSMTKRQINAVALRCFYGQEFEILRRARADGLSQALKDEIERCACECCAKWRKKFKAALGEVQRIANPT